MTATSLGDIYRNTQSLVYLVVETAATADNGDTLAVDLGSYGIAEDGVLMVLANYHSTINSIVKCDTSFTTAVSAGTLTITLDSTAGSDKMRVFLIIGRSEV